MARLEKWQAAAHLPQRMVDEARVLQIVREAGQIALAQWPGAGHALEVWEKSPGHPVCTADLAIDAFLKRELTGLSPEAAWLSEETADDAARLQSDSVWMVDPIDGTRDFIRGRTGWAVSVALVQGGQPVLGVLYAPARQEEWWAAAGRGAWRNGSQLSASARTELAGARVPSAGLSKADRLFTAVAQPNSIALRMGMVAAGEADLLATRRWGYEWDIAAATLLAREAGAATGDAFAKPLRFNKERPGAFGLLVSAPGIFADAATHIEERARKEAEAKA